MKKDYSTQEIADILGVSTRTIQRNLATLRDMLSPECNKYDYELIKIISSVFNYNLCDNKTTAMRQETTQYDTNLEYDRTEYFTEDEYQEFHKRLVEYPLLLEKVKILLNEIDVHKKDKEWHKEQQTKLIESIKERNFIEAKEKKLDK